MKGMLKKFFSVLFVFSFIFVLTGCMKYNTTVSINSDKSMDYSVIIAVATDGDTIDGTSSEIIDEKELKKYEESGFKIEEYTDDQNMKGYTLSKHFNNIDDYSAKESVEFDLSNFQNPEIKDYKIFTLEKGFLKNKYTAKFILSSENALPMSDFEDDEVLNEDDGFDDINSNKNEYYSIKKITSLTETPDVSVENNTIPDNSILLNEEETTDETQLFDESFGDMMSGFEMKFVVNLPSKVISTNATTKENDDKKLTWDLTNYMNSENATLEFSFEMYNMMYIYIGIGVIALIIIILLVSIFKKRNHMKNIPTIESSVVQNNSSQNVGQTNLNNPQTFENNYQAPVVHESDNIESNETTNQNQEINTDNHMDSTIDMNNQNNI